MKKVLIFLSIFGCGFGSGWLVKGHRDKRKAEAEQEQPDTEPEDQNDEPDSSEDYDEPAYKEIHRMKVRKNKIISDQKYRTTDSIQEAVDDANNYLAQFEHPEDDEPPAQEHYTGPNKKIFVSEDTFSQADLNGGEQQCLTYYEDDNTVCDDQEDIVQEADALLPAGWREQFGKDILLDPDIIYCWNEKLEICYEVVRVHNAYHRAVLGMREGD